MQVSIKAKAKPLCGRSRLIKLELFERFLSVRVCVGFRSMGCQAFLTSAKELIHIQ